MNNADEDDIYAPQENIRAEEESGEELEDESDSDIDIITERKDEPKKEPHQESRPTGAKKDNAKPRLLEGQPALGDTGRHDKPTIKMEGVSKEPSLKPGSSYPPVKVSTIDLDVKPIHQPSGKLITDVDMDTDIGPDDKGWRRPGTDLTDFFNYGFDEFTWANYCIKQQTLRKENVDSKKQMDELQNFLGSGMPSMPGMPAGPGGMPNPNDIPPEMQQMFGQMMAQGMDPSQMDPTAFMQMMSGAQGGQVNDQGYGGQNFGQRNQQQGGYGYGGNQGGRGRGRRW